MHGYDQRHHVCAVMDREGLVCRCSQWEEAVVELLGLECIRPVCFEASGLLDSIYRDHQAISLMGPASCVTARRFIRIRPTFRYRALLGYYQMLDNDWRLILAGVEDQSRVVLGL